MRFLLLSVIAALTATCGSPQDSGPVNVAIIGQPESLNEQGYRLSVAAQHLQAATREGLVALDPSGEIIPALAERWIVTEDGLSYIFRLRDSAWPDGAPITAEDVRVILSRRLSELAGTSLALDLAKIEEIRAMTARVVELKLSSPMPEFLRLLAQPELGFVKNGSGAGPMIMSHGDEEAIVTLNALPPQERGLPARDDWEEQAQMVMLMAMPAEAAIKGFTAGEIDLVLNGRLATLPMVQLGPLSRGTIQVDPALGLFGLLVRRDEGLLSAPGLREALSMAIDRPSLIEPFGLGGWQPTEWIIPPVLFETSPDALPPDRWSELTLAERREVARSRVAAWKRRTGQEAKVRLGLPPGPGSDILLGQLARSWQTVGVAVEKAEEGEVADLELRDRLARYSSPRWFLNQFSCSLELGLCSPEADAMVEKSLIMRDPVTKQRLLAEAHAALMAKDIFIPLGAPIRWSLVRGAVSAYRPNRWGLHPLFPLSQPTT
jgi:ABC-type transport system substrate-binding protein